MARTFCAPRNGVLTTLPQSDGDSTATADRVAEDAARLSRKFGGPERYRAPGAESELDKRGNAYSVSKPEAPTASNSAGIYQYGPDYSYFIKAQIGSARQPFYMLLDTGAANTWVMGSNCESDACKIHNTLDPKTSKSWETENKAFSISYGSGDLTGIVGQDTVSFAGLTLDLSFGLANYTHNDFKHFAFDGILGLAMSASVTGTFLHTLRETKLLDSLVFGISLNRDSDGRNDGQVTFGGVDSAKYTGEITYTNVPSPQKRAGEWCIPMDGLSFDGKSAEIPSRLAFIDTGTSFIFAPPKDLAALFKHVPGARAYENGAYVEYKVPCDTKIPINITFSDVTYEISAKDWVVTKDDHCISRLYGYEIKKDTWLLGDTFLKNVYSVFDPDEMRIGFALKAPASAKPTSTPSSTLATAPAKPSSSDDSSRPVMPGFGGHESSVSETAPTATGSAAAPTQTAAGNRAGSIPGVFAACVAAAAIAGIV